MTERRITQSEEELLDGESLARELDGIARQAFPELNPAERRKAIAQANVPDLLETIIDLGLYDPAEHGGLSDK